MNSYFYKEIRQSNIERRIGVVNGAFFGVFAAMIAFLAHMAALRLNDTVFAAFYPDLIAKDCFAPLYIYIKVFAFLSVVYVLISYEHIVLGEIKSNRWYLLAKMGYSTKMMVSVKLLVQMILLLYAFIIGFVGTVGMATLLGYSFANVYLPALFLAGVVEIAFLCALTTALSVLYRFRSAFFTRWCITLTEAALIPLSDLTGYREALSSKSFIVKNGPFAPFSPSVSVYFVILLALIAVLYAASLFNAKTIAMYYDEPLENTDFTLPAGRVLARLDHRNGMFYLFRRKSKSLAAAVHMLIVVLVASIALFTIVLNLFYYRYRNNTVVKVGDTIYFLSDREIVSGHLDDPHIYKNDFLVFKAESDAEQIDDGKIVLIQNGDKLEAVPYAADLKDAEILGKLDSVSRWTGALVLMVCNTEGIILFLVLPLLTLLFFGSIKKLLEKKPVPIE